MSNHTINNLDFAKKNLRLEAAIGLAECPRLTDLLFLADNQQNVFLLRYTLVGATDDFGQARLRLNVVANLPVECQRCLNPMSLSLSFSHEYEVSDMEPAESADTDEFDWLGVDLAMNVATLVEDEVIAAMPIAPIHPDICVHLKAESGEKINPFAVLKGIVKK